MLLTMHSRNMCTVHLLEDLIYVWAFAIIPLQKNHIIVTTRFTSAFSIFSMIDTLRSGVIFMKKLLIIAGLIFLTSCASIGMPDRVQPVTGFELSRYLGTWYEIARLDHSFERGLDNVTADYSMRDGGGVRVINRGYEIKDKEWDSAEGKAFFVTEPDHGYLKVSFFGPFYGSYVVFDLDRDDYQYSMVSGPNTKYLWILARKPQLDKTTMQSLIKKAQAAGFDTSKLIYVRHDRQQ